VTRAANKPDLKGVLLFLGPTFFVSWIAQIEFVRTNDPFGDVPNMFGMAILTGIMWIPGLYAVLLHCMVQRRPFRELWHPSTGRAAPKQSVWKAYAATMLIIPLITACAYGLTWLFGLGTPDWQFARLADLQGSPVSIPDVLGIMLPASIVIGPLINTAATLGEELGWRGFLLPRLMVLGKIRAYLLLGVIWGLWHAPLIVGGFNYPGYPVAGICMMIVACTAFGTFFNELSLSYGSVLLAAWMHAALNAQGYGIWHWMFPDVNPLLGGDTGITGLVVWTAAALLAVRTLRAR